MLYNKTGVPQMKKLFLLAPLALVACVDKGPEAKYPSTHRFKLTVLSAEINNARKDGTAWHTTRPNNELGPLVGLALWSLGVPSETAMLASNMLKSPSQIIPPSPNVSITIGAENHQTPALYGSLTPRWDYQMMLDTSGRARETPMQILVRDQDGGEILGEFKMTLAQLFEKPEHNLSNENLRSLLLKIEPLPATPEQQTYHANISANAPDWQDIRVLNGDTVRISVSGEICPSSWNRDTCSGPAGFENDWLSYNRDGFSQFPHASVVGMLAGEPMFVGQKTEFIVKEPGVLLLGINDNDPSNNLGEFQVTVEINSFLVQEK
jgi:hypothetical protein